MTHDKENRNRLTRRERELTAIGAAIASNCVPCIEYHIPLAQKVGLSDLQIREAIELADKVRKVPADKVLQTAHALLQWNKTREPEDVPCGCPDTKQVSQKSAGSEERERDTRSVHLDNPRPEADNELKSASSRNRADHKTKTCGSEKAEEEQRNSADKSDFDCSGMIEMMGKCCPEKMKDFSSMMDAFVGGCCSTEKEHKPKPSGTATPAA